MMAVALVFQDYLTERNLNNYETEAITKINHKTWLSQMKDDHRDTIVAILLVVDPK